MMREELERLAAEGNLRHLPQIEIEGAYVVSEEKRYLNLSSNDYLGLSCSGLHREFMAQMAADEAFLLSNPSSRLITGNSPDYTRLERKLSAMYDGKAVLVVGCGYMANTGVLPAVTRKGDLILADKLIHASLIDGLRQCEADWKRFNHNDMEHLERLLEKYRSDYRDVWIVTESVFSMDGDRAPLREIVDLKRRYDTKIYLDEAHAFGVYGPDGRGIAAEAGVEDACDVRMATLGKALASQGAFVVTDALTRDFLVNRMRTLIFSTALPPISLRWTEFLIDRLPRMNDRRECLARYVERITGESDRTHIIPLMAGENRRAIEMSRRFREAGYWVMPIRPPTVPQGKARIRISLTAALSDEQVDNFAELCRSIG